MASSSQSLDFSFDALRGFGSRLFGDRPNEARKLARNRGGDHGQHGVGFDQGPAKAGVRISPLWMIRMIDVEMKPSSSNFT